MHLWTTSSILKALYDSGIDEEGRKRLLASGLLPRLLDLFTDPDNVMVFPKKTIFSEFSVEVNVDYSIPLKEMVERSGHEIDPDYDELDHDPTPICSMGRCVFDAEEDDCMPFPGIGEHNFPILRDRSGKVELTIVNFGKEMANQEVLDAFEEKHIMHVCLPELLALGSIHNLLVGSPLHRKTFVALGQHVENDEKEGYPALEQSQLHYWKGGLWDTLPDFINSRPIGRRLSISWDDPYSRISKWPADTYFVGKRP